MGDRTEAEAVEKKIRELERFRNEYFLKNDKGSYDDRERDLRQLITEFLNDFGNRPELSKNDCCYYSGKALNVLSDYDPKCEEQLARAVKLNPNSIEAMNELGSCLWKKSDLPTAKRCFETALDKKRNTVSLRSLSVLYRHEGPAEVAQSKDCTNMRDTFERCLNLAREAVELDPADGENWYALGNAYLTSFFALAQCKGAYIQSALESYTNALKDEEQQFSAELFLNRGIALKYEEDYPIALESFERALKLDPFFSSARTYFQNLMVYLDRVQECVSRKGKVKDKRLREMCSSICRQTDLGPYGGEYKMKTVSGDDVELKYALLKDLKQSRNEFAVVLLKVVGVVINDDTIPYTFCGIDEAGFCTAVTVYNFSEKFGMAIGNTVAILEPFYTAFDFQFHDKNYNFTSIRVPTPEILVVNRKRLGKENCAVSTVLLSRE